MNNLNTDSSAASESVFPQKWCVLSGSALKLIAIITMLIDHTGSILLRHSVKAKAVWFTLLGVDFSVYQVSRDIGRIAFPIFCFLLTEGFEHTHDRVKYGRNLFLFALISEIPWNMWHNSGAIFYSASQNVFFTLLLGYIGFCLADHWKDNHTAQLLSMLALFAVSYYLNADYGWKGYIFLMIMFWLRRERPAQALIGSCWLSYEWKACFAFIPINLYNGKRGFIHGNIGKYAFYAFYPVHILVLLYLRRKLYGI